MPQLEFTSILEEAIPTKEPVHQQLELEIKDQPQYNFVSNNISHLTLWKPQHNVTFSHNNKECGKFSWDDGVFRFEGNAETSAKQFANYIGKFMGMKVES